MKTIQLKVVTPERIFFEGRVKSLTLRGSEGYMGVIYDHTPLVTPLIPGLLRIKTENGERREAAVAQGFAEIMPEKATVITNAAEWSGEIDKETFTNI